MTQDPDFVGLAREFHTAIHAIPALDLNAFVPLMAECLERAYRAGQVAEKTYAPKEDEWWEVECAECKVLLPCTQAEFIEATNPMAAGYWLCRKCASE